MPIDGTIRRIKAPQNLTPVVAQESPHRDGAAYYRKETSNEKPIDNTSGQCVDGRPQPVIIMKKNKERGRKSQGHNGEHGSAPAISSLQVPTKVSHKKGLHNDTLQPNPKRSCKVDKTRETGTTELYLATYNTRTLRTDDDLEFLLEEIQQIKWNIIGLCETKRYGEGLTELPGGSWMYEYNKTEERKEAKGIAFLIHKDFKDHIESFEAHSERVISCKVKLNDRKSLQIINVYAPTSESSDEDIESFYDVIKNAIDKKSCRHHVIMGDFNAKIGCSKQENSKTMGKYGIDEKNPRGERLINFAEEQGLSIANSFFKKPLNRYWTWESPDKKTRNQIDYILTSQKDIIMNCEVISAVNIGSDHRMVRAKIRIDKKLMRLKRILRQKPLRITNIEENKDLFQIKLQNRFEMLKEPPDVDSLHQIIEEEVREISKAKKQAKPEKSEEDKLISEVDKKRRDLYNKENKSANDKIEYAELNKTVKKLRRKRARRKRKELIIKTIEQGRGPKETNKHAKKKKISCMYKPDGEETNDREEILTICSEFYKSLYQKSIDPPNEIGDTPRLNTEEVPEFTKSEVLSVLNNMKKRKAPGNDGISSDILLQGGDHTWTRLTQALNKVLKSQIIPNSWKEAKVIILFKKGDRKDIKNYRPISLLPHTYKLFTRLLQQRMEKELDGNQPREQAGFRKGFSTRDHLQALNQTIEKSNEFNKTLCVGFIDYEKAFDSVEHFSIFEALRKIKVNEIYIQILENIYQEATARIHLDNHVSEPFKIERGVRQGDPISPKLFTAAVEEIFKHANLKEGININGEILKDLRFADDVALCTENTEKMEKNLNILNNESKKIGLKIHKGKTKYMTNYDTNKRIKVEDKEIEEVNEYRYLGQIICPTNGIEKEVNARIRAAWSCFGKNRETLLDPDLPLSLKRKIFNMCILPALTYGCETWALTTKQMKKIRTAQRTMERRMLNIKLIEKVPHKEIRNKTGVTDIPLFIMRHKWRWVGHVGRIQDNRWTKLCTDWSPSRRRRPGRPRRRWSDDITERMGHSWRDTASNRDEWRMVTEGCIQQWMYDA